MLKRDFTSREALVTYVANEFSDILTDTDVSPILGGRQAALTALKKIEPVKYARTRNALDGAVSHLSPYIRHGVLTLAEVRDDVLSKVNFPLDAEKFVNELGWRDYWQRLYEVWGEGIWKDRESPKTGHAPDSYLAELPGDVEGGKTGLACIDGFAAQLQKTGYLHNHARMWTAAYLIHWRKIRWQAGASWFLRHLLDGDPASNNLSWQWVASTFSHKPYIFNRENLERNTRSSYCCQCARRHSCPFDKTYEALEHELFRPLKSEFRTLPVRAPEKKASPGGASPSALFWMHGDGMRQAHASRAVFIFDDEVLKRYRVSLKRLVFMYECLLELEVDIERGLVASKILERAHRGNLTQIVTTASPSPLFGKLRREIERDLPVVVITEPAFAQEPGGELDLTRFSRYWGRVSASALRA